MKSFWGVFVMALLVAVLLIEPAFASTSSTDLPWEDGITKLKNSLTGPLAMGLGVIGIFTVGVILMWGGDLNGLFQKLVIIILVLALVICAERVLKYFYTASGATVGNVTQTRTGDSWLELTPDPVVHSGDDSIEFTDSFQSEFEDEETPRRRTRIIPPLLFSPAARLLFNGGF